MEHLLHRLYGVDAPAPISHRFRSATSFHGQTDRWTDGRTDGTGLANGG